MSAPPPQCCALSAGGSRCTRKVNKASNKGLCGTHMRGTPHGVISESGGDPTKSSGARVTSKIEVRVQEVCGINYYIDDSGNVYDPRDVVGRRPRPRVVGHWAQDSAGLYSIPELGVADGGLGETCLNSPEHESQ